jgi:hypothetical protein
MKNLILAARDKAGELAGECFCNDGTLCDAPDGTTMEKCGGQCSQCELAIPHENCARLREISEWCWHEGVQSCTICDKVVDGITDHIYMYRPTLTIPAMRQLLCDMGLWEKFVRYVGMQVPIKDTKRVPCPVNGVVDLTTFDYAGMQVKFADILTDEQELATAITNFLQEG